MINTDQVVVIILNYNKKKDLLECINSVYSQNYKCIQIVVVDNASSDGSADAVSSKYPDIYLLRNRINLGSVEGRNSGWKFAEKNFDYKYLLFIDDDVIISNNFISKLITVFNNNSKIGIAGGKAYTDKRKNRIMSAGIRANLFNGSVYDIGSGKYDRGQFEQSGFVDACGAFGMMIRRDLFKIQGGFDRNYSPYGWEEVDLCLKVKRSGYFIYYCSDAVLIHKGTKLGRDPNPIYEKSKIKNYIYLLQSNTNLLQKITCTLCLPLRAAKLALKLILKGNAVIIREHLKGTIIGINNIILSAKLNK